MLALIVVARAVPDLHGRADQPVHAGGRDEAGGLVTVPGELSLAAYEQLFSGGVVTRSVLVSLGVTVVGTALSLTVTVLAAYGLSRPGSLLHRPMLFLVLLTFLFGPGMIPSYLLSPDRDQSGCRG